MLAFDELSVLNTQAKTAELFDNLKSENLIVYKDAAKNAQEYALNLVGLMKEDRLLTKDISTEDFEKTTSRQKSDTSSLLSPITIGSVLWLSSYLAKYNKVTGYLYENESDRKRMRYNESILTAREYNDRNLYNTATERAASLWYKQSQEYLIGVVDEATIETYKENGVKYVRWMTEADDRVCRTCRDMHGTVYAIDEVPEKPHYHCRCYLVPVKNKES